MVGGREDAHALEGDSLRVKHTPARKDLGVNADRDLIACPSCLRVRRGLEWIEVEHVIRMPRSYELEAPPKLHSAVYDFRVEAIFSRGAHVRSRSPPEPVVLARNDKAST
jgi:hypothetical protein